MAEVDDLMAEVGENSAKGGRCRGRHQYEWRICSSVKR